MHEHNLTPVQTHQKSNTHLLTLRQKWCLQTHMHDMQNSYVGQTSRNIRQRYKEHTRYIKNNNPQSAYALHFLNNQHEYGPIEQIMTLLKPLINTSLLTTYKQFFIQAFHKSGNLISEQNPGEPNPLFQMVLNPSHPPK